MPDNARFVRRAPVGYFRIFTALHRSCSQLHVALLAARHITVSRLIRFLWLGMEHELYEFLDLAGRSFECRHGDFAGNGLFHNAVDFVEGSSCALLLPDPLVVFFQRLLLLINLILDRFQTRLLLLHLEKICTALGVTLSQFFQEGNSENLTEKQKEVLGIWNDLSTNEQETVMSMLRGLRK